MSSAMPPHQRACQTLRTDSVCRVRRDLELMRPRTCQTSPAAAKKTASRRAGSTIPSAFFAGTVFVLFARGPTSIRHQTKRICLLRLSARRAKTRPARRQTGRRHPASFASVFESGAYLPGRVSAWAQLLLAFAFRALRPVPSLIRTRLPSREPLASNQNELLQCRKIR